MKRTIISKIPEKTRRYLRRSVYRVLNLGFNYRPEEGFNSLKFKIGLYFFLNPKQKIKYINEINFIKRKSRKSFSYSFIFPYQFIFNYSHENIEVFKDKEKDLFYVKHHGKRLYYKRSFNTKTKVQVAYSCTIIEQDKESPHKYLDKNFQIDNNSVVVDVGAAEGNLGLESIEKISRLYIFEADNEWIEALNSTFEPWKNKVTIVNKYVSNTDLSKNITLDSFFKDQHIDFLKIDVEGAELLIFEGSKKLLNQTSLKIAVCTYHKQHDAIKIENTLSDYNFRCEFTNNYMLFVLRKLKPPYFRRGLLRAQK